MRSAAWFPVVVLIVVVLAAGFSWFLSSGDREFLFDGDRGLDRPEVANWWRVQAPMVFGLSIISGAFLIVLLRRARSRAWLEALASIAAAVLGVWALAGSVIYVQQQIETEPVECERMTPESPAQVFLDSQWFEMSLLPAPGSSLPQVEHRMGRPREEGVGLKEYPGYIPYDPFILKRVSFVGLKAREVERLLGPPHSDQSERPSRMTYYMRGLDRHNISATLTLSFADRWNQYETVKAEHLRLY